MEKHFIPGTEGVIYSLPGHFSFGVDSILLSAFSKCKKNLNLMDICSGTGIVALRNALLYKPKKIIGVELQEEPSRLFQKAIRDNGLEGIFTCHQGPFQELAEEYEEQIDILTCNPPYFKKGEGIESASEAMNLSRHEIAMTLEDVFVFAGKVLPPRGKLFLIHRPHRLSECILLSNRYGLTLKRLRPVLSRQGTAPKMILMEFVKGGGDFLNFQAPFVIYKNKNEYTEELLDAYGGEGAWRDN